MKLYKLTDQNWETQNNTKWGPNVTHTAIGDTPNLYSNGVIHAYEDPRLVVLMNPDHANYFNPVLWEAEGDILVSDGTKCGCKSLTTLSIIEIPEVSKNNVIAFGIYSALEVHEESTFVKWANDWLNNFNRTDRPANYAAYYEANYEANYAANAAYYAANAANAANCAAKTANAAKAAYYAAKAAYYAATHKNINFIPLIDKAMEIK